jgi:hypothetical protein
MNGKKRLYRLTIAPSERIAQASIGHGNQYGTQDRFDEVVSAIHEVGSLIPVAQILGVNGTAIVRYRDASGLATHLVGPGGDPTRFTISNGHNFELLHFDLAGFGPAIAPDDFQTTMFVRSEQRVSLADVVELLGGLRKLSGRGGLTVWVRPDAWFLDALQFPLLYPFDPELRLPNRAEFTLVGKVGCGISTSGEITCSGQHFRP